MTIRRLCALVVAPVAAVSMLTTTAPAAHATTKFANCKALNAKYRHGVGLKGAKDHVRQPGVDKPVTNFTVNAAVYKANKRLDRDGDGIACEKH